MKAPLRAISFLVSWFFLCQQTLPAFALPPAVHCLAPWTYLAAGDIEQKKETALVLAEFKTMLFGLAAEDMEPVLVCDLDATVTESNMPILPDNLEKVMKILKKGLHFVVLSGISKKRVDKQFLDPLLASISQEDSQILENLIVASDSGTQIYRYSETTASFECVYAVDIRDYIAAEKYSLIKDILVDLLEKRGVRQMLRETMGWEFSEEEWNVFKKKCVDKRQINGKVTQITFMVLGKEATHEQKEKFDANGGEEIRKGYEVKIEEKLHSSGIELEAKVSGLSSIDINLPGINKGSGLGLISELFDIPSENMIFFGDSFAPEENDEPIVEAVDRVINVGKWIDITGSHYYRENVTFLQLAETGPAGFGLCADMFIRHFSENGTKGNRASFIPGRFEKMVSWVTNRDMTPCVISDLDSTMAESNLPVSSGNLDLVAEILRMDIPYAVVAGADWKKMNNNFVRPLLARIAGRSKEDLLKNLIIVTDNGTQLYRFNGETDDFECIYSVEMKSRIGDDKYKEVMARILPDCINALGVREMLQEVTGRNFTDAEWGEFIKKEAFTERKPKGKEEVTQITWSLLGVNASRQEKLKFDATGGQILRRFKYKPRLERELLNVGINLDIGVSGTSSIELTPRGVNKGSAMPVICREFGIPLSSVIFFGDNFEREGTDRTVLEFADKVINLGRYAVIPASLYKDRKMDFLQLPDTGPRGFNLLIKNFLHLLKIRNMDKQKNDAYNTARRVRRTEVKKAFDLFYTQRAKTYSVRQQQKDGLADKVKEHYIVHYADAANILSETRNVIISPGLEIERRRKIMGIEKTIDMQHDKFFITAPEECVTKEEKESLKKRLIEFWMLDGVIDAADIVILDRISGGYTASALFSKIRSENTEATADNTGFLCMAGDLTYDDDAVQLGLLQLNLSSESKTNVDQYEVFIALLLSEDPDNILRVAGLRKTERGNLFIYMPQSRPVDLAEKIRIYERHISTTLIRA